MKRSNIVQEWRSKMREWIEPMGFSLIWSENHPSDSQDKIHFIKDGIRFCCEREGSHEQLYLLHEFWYKYKEHIAMSTRTYITSNWTSEKILERVEILKDCKDSIDGKDVTIGIYIGGAVVLITQLVVSYVFTFILKIISEIL